MGRAVTRLEGIGQDDVEARAAAAIITKGSTVPASALAARAVQTVSAARAARASRTAFADRLTG